MDATRISDGRPVVMKLLLDNGERNYEREILEFLCSPHLRSDPRNHTVELLDVFKLPNSGNIVIVMPMLRWFNSPEFQTVGEAVEFLRQIFEARAFRPVVDCRRSDKRCPGHPFHARA